MPMILVTGASGFIGRHLVDELIRRRFSVRVLVRKKASIPFHHGQVEICFGDIADPASLEKAVEGVDRVFHLAAVINLEQESMRGYQAVNVTGTKNLFKAIKARNVKPRRFVFCSSVGVYGRLQSIPADENTPCHPINYYEKSKFEAEEAVRAFGRAMQIPISIIRPSWVYGPGDRRTFKLFQAINKNRFWIIGHGKTLVHPVYVSDVAQGLVKSAFKAKGENDTFIIAGRRYVSLKRLVTTIAKALNKKIPKIHIPVFMAKTIAKGLEKVYAPFHSIPPVSSRRLEFFLKDQAFDISKARREIGYRPGMRLESGIQKTVTWYRDHGWL